MTLEELQKRFDTYGGMHGCRMETDNPSSLGWITVILRKVAAVTRVDPHEQPERFAEWEAYVNEVKEKPYLVNVYEVNADAYEAETTGEIDYMAPEDYGKRENYYLRSLNELPTLLAKFDKTVDDLLPQSELLAP